jgi:hypothetical protein
MGPFYSSSMDIHFIDQANYYPETFIGGDKALAEFPEDVAAAADQASGAVAIVPPGWNSNEQVGPCREGRRKSGSHLTSDAVTTRSPLASNVAAQTGPSWCSGLPKPGVSRLKRGAGAAAPPPRSLCPNRGQGSSRSRVLARCDSPGGFIVRGRGYDLVRAAAPATSTLGTPSVSS